ncbi:hypothetical protein [Umezawaea beigongshangensis]|uniref:hypothetical protein n=1 Tax=Umezawaea beigongshangensis TaxID=2780383 RepID=UPI0018F22153|nr:hypothetical protein [Umezawaea beigongshangensis]
MTTTVEVRDDRLLRFACTLDGIASGGLGVLALLVGPLLDLGLPRGLLLGVGAFLVVYGIAVYVIGTRPRISRPLVRVVVIGNLLWVVDSALTALAGWFPITVLGQVVVLVQAAAVVGIVVLQIAGLRRR